MVSHPTTPAHHSLMLSNVHIRPITKIQTVTILRHPLCPHRDDSRLSLVIYRQPAYIGDSNLFSFIIKRNTLITTGRLSLLHRLVKLGIVPPSTIIVGRREEIEVQPIIGVGKISSP